MYTTGQIFEGSYPPAVAQWCKKNRAYVKEIEAVTRQQEKKILISEAEFDDEGNMISPERYKTVIEDVRVRRFQIVAIPEPTPEEQEAALQKHYTDIVQRLLDAEAQKLGYDNCNSVCTYVDTGVNKFDCEGVAFRKWRSAVWAKGYELLAEVQAGTRPVPTEEELVELLPKLVIEYDVVDGTQA